MSPGRVRGFRRHRRDHLVLGIGRSLEDHVDLAGGEAGQRQVEIDVEHRQLAELELQEIEVPAGAERDLVVGDPQRPLLRLREMRQRDRRHLGHADRLRRQQPAVAGDDPALGIDQDRVGEAERADRGGDLLELPLRVGAGVARVGDKAADRPVADGERSQAVRRRTVIGIQATGPVIIPHLVARVPASQYTCSISLGLPPRTERCCSHARPSGLVPVAAKRFRRDAEETTMTTEALTPTAEKPAAHAAAPGRRRPRPPPRARPRSSSRSWRCSSRPEGASLAELVAATGWQAHSVRGALAGSLKRKGHAIRLGEGRRRTPLPDRSRAMTAAAEIVASDRARWRARSRSPARPLAAALRQPRSRLRSPELLRLLLAWRLQAAALGGLDPETRTPAAAARAGAGRGPRARGRCPPAPDLARHAGRGGGRGRRLPLERPALPEPLGGGDGDRRLALERPEVLRPAAARAMSRPSQALRALHPQELGGGARAGLQQPARAARGLRRLRQEPGERRLAGARHPLRRRRLLRRLDRAAGAAAAARRHRRRQGRCRRGLQDRPADPVARRLRPHGRALRPAWRQLRQRHPGVQHHQQHGAADPERAALLRAVRARGHRRAHPRQDRRLQGPRHVDGRQPAARLRPAGRGPAGAGGEPGRGRDRAGDLPGLPRARLGQRARALARRARHRLEGAHDPRRPGASAAGRSTAARSSTCCATAPTSA